ncbi:GSCOCG00012132001-RA-CDS [Cotesia congregata]|nr:GSCOCG00012132001-RA-CDS [Cotesia congregata]
MEGTQYESNMGLLSTDVAHHSILNSEGINEEIIESDNELKFQNLLQYFLIWKHHASLNNLIFYKSRLNTINLNFQFMLTLFKKLQHKHLKQMI